MRIPSIAGSPIAVLDAAILMTAGMATLLMAKTHAGAMARRISCCPGKRRRAEAKTVLLHPNDDHRHAAMHPAASGRPHYTPRRLPFDARRLPYASVEDFRVEGAAAVGAY
jgi:hypothetical protein